MVGGKATDPAVVDWTVAFYNHFGKYGLKMTKELPGFLANRLQEAIWREALEESGLPELQVERRIFDLDAHIIPARGDEPEHIHWDVRYVVYCRGSEAFVVSQESLALAWVPLHQVLDSPDPSLRRMAQRWLARRGFVLPQARVTGKR